jgi:hypothetical protein
MEVKSIMRIMDGLFRTQRRIELSLHEIDRRALNAIVLVKRHGNRLASYGVVAQAFREQAIYLKEAAIPLQQSITPLVHVQTRILQLRRYIDVFQRTAQGMHANDDAKAFLSQSKENWQHNIDNEAAEEVAILRRLVEIVVRLQEGITAQEYVVTNGRIEAALSEQSAVPLMRVSHEMGLAVAKIRDAIWKYRGELEEVLHESSASI